MIFKQVNDKYSYSESFFNYYLFERDNILFFDTDSESLNTEKNIDIPGFIDMLNMDYKEILQSSHQLIKDYFGDFSGNQDSDTAKVLISDFTSKVGSLHPFFNFEVYRNLTLSKFIPSHLLLLRLMEEEIARYLIQRKFTREHIIGIWENYIINVYSNLQLGIVSLDKWFFESEVINYQIVKFITSYFDILANSIRKKEDDQDTIKEMISDIDKYKKAISGYLEGAVKSGHHYQDFSAYFVDDDEPESSPYLPVPKWSISQYNDIIIQNQNLLRNNIEEDCSGDIAEQQQIYLKMIMPKTDNKTFVEYVDDNGITRSGCIEELDDNYDPASKYRESYSNTKCYDIVCFSQLLFIISKFLCEKGYQNFKICKNCHRPFIAKRSNQVYCNYLASPDSNKTCREIGASKINKSKTESDPYKKAIKNGNDAFRKLTNEYNAPKIVDKWKNSWLNEIDKYERDERRFTEKGKKELAIIIRKSYIEYLEKARKELKKED